MPSRTLQYATIFLTVFIDVLGFGIVIPVLPIYAEHFGASPLEIGGIVGIFSLMQFLLAPFWGRLSDRFGRRPMLLAGMVGTVAGYLLMGFAGSVLALFVARLVAGAAGANIGVAHAYLADLSTPETRARAMGLLGAAFGMGLVFGPALGGLASERYGYPAPMFMAAGLGVVNLVFVAMFLPESHRGSAPAPHAGLLRGLADHVRGRQYAWSLAAYFSVITGFSMLTTIFALYVLHRFGLGLAQTGAIFAGMGLLGAVVQGGLTGRLVKRFGEAGLARTGTVLMAAGLAGLAVAGSVPTMVAMAFLAGLGNSLLMPSLTSLASRAADPEWQGRALGVLQSGGSLARFLGPMAAGTLLALETTSPSRYGMVPLATASAILAIAFFVTGGLARRLDHPAA
jgi:MFS transporter, DHA1 family, tetracycline resistance protein